MHAVMTHVNQTVYAQLWEILICAIVLMILVDNFKIIDIKKAQQMLSFFHFPVIKRHESLIKR